MPSAGGRGAPIGATPQARPAPQPSSGTPSAPSRFPVLFKALTGYTVDVTVRSCVLKAGPIA